MYLITGGSGFIGTNLINKLLLNNISLINIDIKKPKLKDHEKYWIELDILNFKGVDKIFKENNILQVFHLAARTDIFGKNIDEYDVNIQGTKNLVKLVNKYKISYSIFFSSMLVNKPNLHDSKSYDPYENYYAASKVESEIIVKKLINKNLIYSIVRPTSIWGPFMGEHYMEFFKRIKNKRYFHISEKNPIKTYGYVENIVNQILFLSDKMIFEKGKTFYYLGDKENYFIKEWSSLIAKNFNVKIFTLPFLLFKIVSIFGDILKYFEYQFPLTSYRLNNLTSDNKIPIDEIFNNLNYISINDATKKTIIYLKVKNEF